MTFIISGLSSVAITAAKEAIEAEAGTIATWTTTLGGGGETATTVSVALNGGVALIGAPGVSSDAGAAYIYAVDADGSWDATATTTFNGGSGSTDKLGSSVALNGDGGVALIGAPGVSTGAGAAYIYAVDADGSWEATPTATTTFNGGIGSADELGSSVALNGDGDLALIGAPGVSTSAGAAYIYAVDADGIWETTATTTFNGGIGSADELGSSVALNGDGDLALIGAPGVSTSAGAAYIYAVDADGIWETTATTTFNGGISADKLGSSVALNGDGGVALIGAPGAFDRAGLAYIFEIGVSSEGAPPSWASITTETAVLWQNSGLGDGLFGSSVALDEDGGVALIGAPDAAVYALGEAYRFEKPTTGWTSTSEADVTLSNTTSSPSDKFGYSVALDGDVALIGNDIGAAYIIDFS